MHARSGFCTGVYRRHLDPRGTPAEACGYWLVVLGTVVALTGVAAFLWGSTYPRGTAPYWAYRQAGITLAAGGLPVVLLGMTFRLPLQPVAAALGSLGGLLCAAAIVWFVTLYPRYWTFAGPRPVLLTYTAGMALLAVGLTLAPMVATPGPADRDADLLRQPYYELRHGPDGWTWRLYGGDDALLAESSARFARRTDARDALRDLSVVAPVAGTEVTTGRVA